jgi:hypothetical protein
MPTKKSKISDSLVHVKKCQYLQAASNSLAIRTTWDCIINTALPYTRAHPYCSNCTRVDVASASTTFLVLIRARRCEADQPRIYE